MCDVSYLDNSRTKVLITYSLTYEKKKKHKHSSDHPPGADGDIQMNTYELNLEENSLKLIDSDQNVDEHDHVQRSKSKRKFPFKAKESDVEESGFFVEVCTLVLHFCTCKQTARDIYNTVKSRGTHKT